MHIRDSARLRFRLMDENDGELLYQLDQDPEVMKYINGGRPTSREDVTNIFLPRMARYRNPEKGWGIWQVTLKESGEYLGWILVRPMHFFSDGRNDADLELGWRFKRSSWGQGFAGEAAARVVDALTAAHPELEAFSAIAQQQNLGSIAIMKKLGMTFVKKDLYHDPLGEWDVVLYSKAL